MNMELVIEKVLKKSQKMCTLTVTKLWELSDIHHRLL